MDSRHEDAKENEGGVSSEKLPSIEPLLTKDGMGIDYSIPHYSKVVEAIDHALTAQPDTEESRYLVDAMSIVFRPENPDWDNWSERQGWLTALQEALLHRVVTHLKNNSDLADSSELREELVNEFRKVWAPDYLNQLDEGIAVGPLWPYVQQRWLEILGNRRVALQNRDHSIGILFVHGIGKQQQGETLDRCSRPIIEYLGERAHVRTADICGDDEVPANTVVDMPGEGVSWLLAESWWAKQFLPPGFGELAPWLLTIGPYMVLAHLGKWASGRFQSAVTVLKPSKDRRWLWIVALPLLTMYFLAMLIFVMSLSFVLTISLQVFVLILGFLSTIPIVKTRATISRLLGILSSILGDSLAFVDNPVARSAIISKVRGNLDWLANQADQIVVVAHSQGAAVAHHALRRGAPSNVKMLITLGSGLGKLERASSQGLGILQRSTGWVVSTLPLYVWFVPFLIEALGNIALYVGLFYLTVYLGAIFSGIRKSQVHLSIDPIRWSDYYASHDPVPNGALSLEPKSWITCHEVCNYASFIGDHTSYFENHDEFIPAILRDIKENLGTGSVERNIADRVISGAKARKRRVLWLQLIRIVTGIAAVGGGFLASQKLAEFGNEIVQLESTYLNTSILSRMIDTSTSVIQHFLQESSSAEDLSRGILGWICLLVLLAPVYIITRRIWAIWNAADMREAMKNGYGTHYLLTESIWSGIPKGVLRMVGIGVAVGATILMLTWNGSDLAKHAITIGSIILALVLSIPTISTVMDGKSYKLYTGIILIGMVFMLWIAWRLPNSTTLWQPYTDISDASRWLIEQMQIQPGAFAPVVFVFGMPLIVAIVQALNSKSS